MSATTNRFELLTLERLQEIYDLIISAPPGAAAWGTIGAGTGVGSQTDLVTYLNANYYPLASNPAGYLTSASLSGYLTIAAAAATYYPLTNPAGYITSAALSSYLTIVSAAATYVPLTRNITINGVTQDLSADRTWTVSAGVSSVSAVSPITSSGGSTPIISTSMSTDRLIGRATVGTGVMEEISLGSGLSLSGTTLNAGNIDLSEISVSTSNAREDDYAPVGWPGSSSNITKVIRLSTTNTNNITSLGGLASGTAGRTITIANGSANGMLILEHESTSSTAANRFSLNQNSTYFLLPGRIITFIYTGSRWTQMTLSNIGGFDLYDEMTNGQQQYTGTHVSNLYNWITSPNSNAIRSEGAQNEQLGVIGFTTLTSATSSMRAAMGTRTDTGGFITSASPKPVFSLIKLKLPVAPTVAQDFEAFFGFTNSTTTTTTSGGYWWYLPTAASGNTFWQNVSTNNTGSSANIVNTTLAASTITDIYLGVFFTGNTGDCIFIFSTNGITYSIGSKFGYTSGNYEGKPFFGMNKTVGTTARLILVDSAGISYNIRR